MSPNTDEFPVDDLQEALRGAGVGIWAWDLATGAVRWSDITMAIYELAPGEFGGTFDAFETKLHPEDRQRVSDAIQVAVATLQQDYVIEYRLLFHDERIKWLEGRGRVIAGADGKAIRMVGTLLEVTERKVNDEKLRKGEERLRLFTSCATDYVYDATISGELALPEIVAGSFERTTGMTPQEVADRGGWVALIHPDDREHSRAMLPQLMQGHSVVNEYRIIDGSGRTRWLRDRVVPILNSEGVLARLVGGVSDITEQRALEERLVEAQRMESLARLAAGVAHDFNNLLTVLMAESSFLRDPEATEQLRGQSLYEIDTTLERAANLTSSLLAFGRKNVSPLMVIELGDAVAKSRAMLTRAAGERAMVEISRGDAAINVVADPNDIHLVLLNLTLNARDSMPHGGRILVDSRAVQLQASDPDRPPELSPGSYARLSVQDEGAGIAKEVRDSIFEPYFTTKGYGGTGLGLPTCLGIVKRYGGVLRLGESQGKGSVFQIFLPASPLPVATPALVPGRTTIGGHEHILLVEDDASVRNVAMRILKDRGYKVTAAASAEEALAMGDALDRIDGVLTDVRMPGKSGLAMASELRYRRSDLPILVMSGHVEDPEQQMQLSEGKYPFIAKPFSSGGLLLRMREVLDANKS